MTETAVQSQGTGVHEISIAWSPAPRQVRQLTLAVASGTTVQEALTTAGLVVEAGGRVAIWGRTTAPDHVVARGDRIELCRPLRVDPKVARRQRFSRQGVKTAGLFANRRPGSKPGY